jgi:hypothetical protein
VLAVDFHDFYRQHFPGFHTFMAKIMLKLFIVMSSTSFGDYLIAGAHYINFGQIGRKPGRPGTEANTCQNSPAGPQTQIQSTLTRISSSKTSYGRRLEPRIDGPTCSDYRGLQAQNRLPEAFAHVDQRVGASEG